MTFGPKGAIIHVYNEKGNTMSLKEIIQKWYQDITDTYNLANADIKNTYKIIRKNSLTKITI